MSGTNGLHDRIGRVLTEALNLEVPAVDTDLFETGLLDSLGFVNLLLHLEQAFGVTTSLDDLEIDNFRSIARIADFVMTRAVLDAGALNQSAVAAFTTEQ